jgi:hypothetical protein
MKRKVVQHGVLWTAVALFAGIAWTMYREHKLATAFQQMQVGTVENETRVRLGSPWKVGACGQIFGGSFPPGCREEYIYASPYAPIIPRYWAFRFDEKGRLIDKYKYQSP